MKGESVLFRNECRFCEVGHTFDTDEYEFTLRMGTEGKLIVEGHGYAGKTDEIMINFCPMCGRRLY